MPGNLSTFSSRALAVRTKSMVSSCPRVRFLQHRKASDDASKKSPDGPNTNPLPHVSEEQAAVDKAMGETPPDIEQGTPVQEILKRDPEALKKAPEVTKQQIKHDSTNQKRSYSTSSRRHAVEAQIPQSQDLSHIQNSLMEGSSYPDAGFGHKFVLPDVASMPRTDHLKRRYDPVVDQVTKAIMRHGKLSAAQKNMSIILNTLRTAPPPQANTQFSNRALITSSPRIALPLSPVDYLTTVIDSLAPLLKIRQQRGIAGGGASLPIPIPLGKRQRRRTAIQWILASADSRKETRLADRVAKELINVAEGKSSAWEKRALVHKLAVSARSNVRVGLARPGGRR